MPLKLHKIYNFKIPKKFFIQFQSSITIENTFIIYVHSTCRALHQYSFPKNKKPHANYCIIH